MEEEAIHAKKHRKRLAALTGARENFSLFWAVLAAATISGDVPLRLVVLALSVSLVVFVYWLTKQLERKGPS